MNENKNIFWNALFAASAFYLVSRAFPPQKPLEAKLTEDKKITCNDYVFSTLPVTISSDIHSYQTAIKHVNGWYSETNPVMEKANRAMIAANNIPPNELHAGDVIYVPIVPTPNH